MLHFVKKSKTVVHICEKINNLSAIRTEYLNNWEIPNCLEKLCCFSCETTLKTNIVKEFFSQVFHKQKSHIKGTQVWFFTRKKSTWRTGTPLQESWPTKEMDDHLISKMPVLWNFWRTQEVKLSQNKAEPFPPFPISKDHKNGQFLSNSPIFRKSALK